MEQALHFATGPMFRFSIAVMVLGSMRLLLITVIDIVQTMNRAGKAQLEFGVAVSAAFSWIFPVRQIMRTQFIFSLVSFLFHAGLILVPVFLIDHIALIENSTGFGWMAFPAGIADALTLLVIGSGAVLLAYRTLSRDRRFVSQFSHYIQMSLICAVFITGYSASSPLNPLSFTNAYFIHAVLGNILLMIIPFTRLSHAVIYPVVRIATAAAWHFPPDSGKLLNKRLYGEEDRRI